MKAEKARRGEPFSRLVPRRFQIAGAKAGRVGRGPGWKERRGMRGQNRIERRALAVV